MMLWHSSVDYRLHTLLKPSVERTCAADTEPGNSALGGHESKYQVIDHSHYA